MKCWLEFIHTPSLDVPGTLCFLHFDERRYLIGNLSEGTSRVVLQQNVGLRKVSDILLSGRTEWQNLGGIIGTILNLGEMKKGAAESQAVTSNTSRTKEVEALRLHGAPNLTYTLATARRFVFRQGLPIRATEHAAVAVTNISSPSWSDEFIKAWVMPVLPTTLVQAQQPPPLTQVSQEDYADQSAGDIVEKMFNSDWKYDRLIKTRLPDVLPPTIPFIRGPDGYKRYEGPKPGGSEPVPNIEVWVREPWPAANAGHLPPTQPCSEALSYIIRNHPQRGKFDVKKAKELSVAPGPNFGLLSKGHSVQNTRGETITSDMVLEPGTLGTGFAFIDIPSVAYIDELLSRPEWRNQDVMEGVIAMIWNIGPTVADDTRILQFQNEFTTLQHIISAQDKSPDDFVLESAVKQDMRNHKLAPETFPMIRHDTSKGIIPSSFSVPGKLSLKYRPTKKVHREEALSTSHKMAQRGLRLVLEPRVEFEVDGLKPVYDPVHMMRETEEDVKDFGLPSQSEDVMVDSDVQFRWERAVPWTKAEVLCLGTGSSHPGTYRNVSGSLVRFPGDGSYLLDAGEGTLGTLRRMYSPEELNGVLRDLRMIWISHLHADHHLGITSVIKAWYQATHNSVPADISSSRAGPSLCIVSDVHMLDWLQEYSHVEDFGFSRITCVATVPSHMGGLSLYSGNVPGTSTFVQPPGRESPPLYDSSRLVAQDLRQAMSLRYLQAALVNHCHGAQAVSFTTRAGLKVSYSGDCRPSFKFADIGKGSHVLIHEATFEEDMRDEAMAKKHSTAGEALLVAAQMQAKSVILTHFSQRYPKMSAFNTSHKLPIATDKATTNAASTRSTPPPTSPAGSRRNSNPNSGRPSSPGEAYASLIKPTGSLGPLLAANPNMRVVMAFDYMRLQLGNIPRFEAQQPRMRALYDALSAAAEAGHEDGPHEDDENANNSVSKDDKQKSDKRQVKSERRKTNRQEAHLRRQRSRSASSENSKQRQHHGKLPGSSPARSEKRARTDSGERTG